MRRVEKWGRIAYEAYFEKSGGVSLVNGDGLPRWEDQSDERQDAWIAAGNAVRDEARKGHDSYGKSEK